MSKKVSQKIKQKLLHVQDNFHGRTMTAVSLSSDAEYQRGFGPMLPGIKLIPYGDLEALEKLRLHQILLHSY